MSGVSEMNPAPAVGPDHDEGLAHPAAVAPGALQVRLARLEKLLGADRLGELPAWLRRTSGEHRLPVGLAIIALILVQFKIPAPLAFKPWYLLPAIEAALFLVLTVASPWRINRESTLLRAIGLGLVTVASVATLWSAARLAYGLIHGIPATNDAIQLLLNAGAVWLTSVIVFALWYWEFDRGGPAARANARKLFPDFLFPQMTAPTLAPPEWEPTFVDYLYLSFTNTTAFSPTDVMPLSRWAKLAMFVQSGTSLVLVALVVARAVNILS
jgi:hypothetical protein